MSVKDYHFKVLFSLFWIFFFFHINILYLWSPLRTPASGSADDRQPQLLPRWLYDCVYTEALFPQAAPGQQLSMLPVLVEDHS